MLVRRKKNVAPAEARQYQRVALEAEVTIDSEHNFYCGLSENISEGGLFIATYQLAELGRELELTFTLPVHDQPLKVRAKVQWLREYSILNCDLPPGVGLQFIDPSPEVLLAVRKFIAQRDPAFYDE